MTWADVGAGDRDEAGNGSMLAHLSSIKDDLEQSTVFEVHLGYHSTSHQTIQNFAESKGKHTAVKECLIETHCQYTAKIQT